MTPQLASHLLFWVEGAFVAGVLIAQVLRARRMERSFRAWEKGQLEELYRLRQWTDEAVQARREGRPLPEWDPSHPPH